LEYKVLCEKIVESDPNISYAFVVNSTARLVALSGVKNAPSINEERFAELLEDVSFMANSRKHYEDLYGMIQFVHIRHTRSDTFIFPFEAGQILCLCLGTSEYNETEFLEQLQNKLPSIYQFARQQSSSKHKKANYGFSLPT